MRIAQVAPLYESVPPRLYGGTERVVHFLTEELLNQGHDVTLFASGDSNTRARLVAPCPRALRLEKTSVDKLAPHYVLLEKVFQRVDEFDIIHFHVDYLHYSLSRRCGVPHVTTLHGRLDLPDLVGLYDEFAEVSVVSISDAQRKPLPHLNWQGTVYHGYPPELFHPGDGSGGYLAFLGRISPEKRVDRAIEIARHSGIPLKVAAKVDPADRVYFEQTIQKLLEDPLVEYLGEIGEREKQELLGNAKALLFPIDWPEPFGLVLIESLACGTPVIAFKGGSVEEILDDGGTGFVVDNIDDAIEAVSRIGKISRQHCRDAFEMRFTASRMAADYVEVYGRLMARRVPAASAVESFR